jgi:hypothetical protein
MPPLTWPVEGCQFLLERFVKQVMPMAAQKHKQLGSPYPSDDLVFLFGECNGGLPKARLHGLLLAFMSDQLIVEHVHESFGKLRGE